MNEEIVLKFLKFGIVGLSGMGIDFSITYLLKEKLRLNKYVSSVAGFLSAATSNFILNRVWTFESLDPLVAAQYIKFLVICVIGVLISTSLIYLLNGRLKWNFYLSKLISIGIVIFWNFLANYYFTFS